jgi:alpha-L-arabinofuranosidase
MRIQEREVFFNRQFLLALSFCFVCLPVTVVAQSGTDTSTPTASASLKADQPGPRINRDIFGQFTEHLGSGIYGGIWVGPRSDIPNEAGYRSDVLAALRAIKVPMVRWPGGCFADEYHWRDGIGPRAKRPVKVNTNWGGVNEDNSFGTHEFMGFAERLRAKAFIAVNVGSGTPAETSQWVEYMTAPANSTVLAKERVRNGRTAPWKIDYLGIGNELWGCGGNMRAEFAADLTNQFGQFAKSANGSMLKIASGPSDANYEWTETLMRNAGKNIDGLSLHYYTRPREKKWEDKGPALGFPESEWASTLAHTMQMETYIARHSAIMDKYDPTKRVMLAVDEWGTWYDTAPGANPGFLQQQNSLRDAMVAALNIHIFARHAERVRMAAIAQMVNVLQAILLTDGPRMVKTPTYHVFDLYQPWQDAQRLPIDIKTPAYQVGEFGLAAVHVSAVRAADGDVHVALVNVDPNRPVNMQVSINGLQASSATGRIITAGSMDAHNSFGAPTAVEPMPFTGAVITGDRLNVTLPAKSIVVFRLR